MDVSKVNKVVREVFREERLYSIREVAERLGMSRRAVYDAIKRGDLDAVHVGKLLRISKSALRQWLFESEGGYRERKR